MSKVIRKVTSGAIQLTPNFYLEEFICDPMAARLGINNSPDPLAILNINRVAKVLELVLKALGHKPLIIKSGFQSVELNQFYKDTEDHLRGASVDFTCPTFGNPEQVLAAIAAANIPGAGRLFIEHTWIHLGLEDNK